MLTSKVKTPATVHPILCASQCQAPGVQKLDWSILAVLSDGQRIIIRVGRICQIRHGQELHDVIESK
jgi:hypothetical protein